MTGEVSWFKFNPRDWLAKTGGLSPSDKGILADLQAIMHERGEPVPFNEKVLAARCRATPKTFKKAVETLIEAGLIHLEDGRIWSGTMQDQIEFERRNHLIRKTAAEKRWKKIKQNQSHGDTDAMLYESEITDTEGKTPKGSSPSTTQSTSSSTQSDHKQDTRSAAPDSASAASSGNRASGGDVMYIVAILQERGVKEAVLDKIWRVHKARGLSMAMLDTIQRMASEGRLTEAEVNRVAGGANA